jgi:hypothetical protein
MDNKGFIFTMDAILAIIPVFIVLASVSSLSYSDNLFTQAFMVGGERAAYDVLKVLDTKSELNQTNCTLAEQNIANILPVDYYYNYQLIYNGTSPGVDPAILCNFTNGNMTNAPDIVATRRIAPAKFYRVIANFIGLSHYARERSEPCWMNPARCGNGVGQSQFNGSFFIQADAKQIFSYWLLAEQGCEGCAVPAWWGIDPYNLAGDPDVVDPDNYKRCPAMCTGAGTKPPNSMGSIPEEGIKEELTIEITEGRTNVVYIQIEGNPDEHANFWFIEAPKNAVEADITVENALLYSWVMVKMEVWQK